MQVTSRSGNGRYSDHAAKAPGVRRPARTVDYLVVGAGFAGSVIAERLASQAGQSLLLVDRRPHLGGNAYDHYDEAGILVHKYGPHIFHTNSERVFRYLSAFTAWRPYEHRVKAWVDGQLLPIPINLDTVNQLYGLQLTSDELALFFAEGLSRSSARGPPRTSSSEPSAAISTRSSSVATRASSGGSTPPSSTRPSLRACRHGRAATTGTSPTPSRRCRCMGTRGCSIGWSDVRGSRSCWARTIGSSTGSL